jgi:hypothetical protein
MGGRSWSWKSMGAALYNILDAGDIFQQVSPREPHPRFLLVSAPPPSRSRSPTSPPNSKSPLVPASSREQRPDGPKIWTILFPICNPGRRNNYLCDPSPQARGLLDASRSSVFPALTSEHISSYCGASLIRGLLFMSHLKPMVLPRTS